MQTLIFSGALGAARRSAPLRLTWEKKGRKICKTNSWKGQRRRRRSGARGSVDGWSVWMESKRRVFFLYLSYLAVACIVVRIWLEIMLLHLTQSWIQRPKQTNKNPSNVRTVKFYDLAFESKFEAIDSRGLAGGSESQWGVRNPTPRVVFPSPQRFLEPLGSDFEVRLKVVFLRPTSENFHKKTNKQIFGGLEQVTSLSHAEGQRGWTEVYVSTGIKDLLFLHLGQKWWFIF